VRYYLTEEHSDFTRSTRVWLDWCCSAV